MVSISILGSTGSIGTQVLDVCKRISEEINIVALGAMENAELLIEQIKEFQPKYACIGNPNKYNHVKENIPKEVILLSGEAGFVELAQIEEVSKVIISIAGFPGFYPTIAAIKLGKTVCLASKEVLVAAGHIVMAMAEEYKVKILPIDSEHSAIFQCLNGEDKKEIKKIILTASGGAFRDKSIEELANVTAKEALNHPTWKMGKKVTIDSATLMNKGLEVIEAKWLFNVTSDQINVLLHKQSIVHSMVEFMDTSVIAQLGLADMRVPIQYSLMYPKRINNNLESLDLAKLKELNFDYVNYDKFPCLKLAFNALSEGGSTPCVMNAADNAAVNLFLNNKIGFLDIAKIVEKEITNHKKINNPDIDTIINIDKEIHDKLYFEYK